MVKKISGSSTATLWILICFNEDPDPGSQTNADPVPGQTFKLKVIKHTYKSFWKGVIQVYSICYFLSISFFLDPDPEEPNNADLDRIQKSQTIMIWIGSRRAKLKRIRIHTTLFNSRQRTPEDVPTQESTANSPGERNAVGRVIRIGDGEGEEDVSVGLVLLHEHGVVALGEDGRVVVGVLNEDVDEDAGGEQRRPKVPCLHLQHWESK